MTSTLVKETVLARKALEEAVEAMMEHRGEIEDQLASLQRVLSNLRSEASSPVGKRQAKSAEKSRPRGTKADGRKRVRSPEEKAAAAARMKKYWAARRIA